MILLLNLPMCCLQGSDMQVVVQAGLMTHQRFDFEPTWAVASVQLAVHFNDFLFVSPEAFLMVPELKFKPAFYWAPGATLNYAFGDLFAGLGAFRWIELSGEERRLERFWRIKGQVGFFRGSLCLTLFAFMSAESLFRDMNIGLMAGIVL